MEGITEIAQLRPLPLKANQLELKTILDEMRHRGEEAKLTQEDVLEDIEEGRK